jgi:hypothetical protein
VRSERLVFVFQLHFKVIVKSGSDQRSYGHPKFSEGEFATHVAEVVGIIFATSSILYNSEKILWHNL